jgi:hypothetical protein
MPADAGARSEAPGHGFHRSKLNSDEAHTHMYRLYILLFIRNVLCT